jgi:hypothetical protein
VRRTRTPIVLAVLAAAIGAAVWWDHRRPSTEEAKESETHLVPGFERDRVTGILVERGGRAARLRRSDGAWTIDGVRADEDAVEALLSEIEFARVERRVGPIDAQLGKMLGLDAPRVTLELDGTRLQLGADSPGGRGVYVARRGSPEAMVVEHRLLEVADRAPEAWRSSRLLLTNVGGAKTLAIGGMTVARHDGGWTVDGAPASNRAVDALFDAIDRARARRFVEGPAPAGGVSIAVDGHVEARLLGPCAGATGETEVARSDGAHLCFDDAALARLRAPAAGLREPRLFPFAVDAVTAVDVEEGSRRLALRRENGAWRLIAPLDAAGPADDPSVRAWLGQLVALTSEGGPQLATVKTAEASATHHVRDQSLDPLRFHDRRVIDLAGVDRLTVEEHGRRTVITSGLQARSFRADPPVTATDEALQALFDAFARLRATGFVHTPLPPAEVRTISGGGRTLELVRTADGCLGKSGGLVFTLAAGDCRALLAPLGKAAAGR